MFGSTVGTRGRGLDSRGEEPRPPDDHRRRRLRLHDGHHRPAVGLRKARSRRSRRPRLLRDRGREPSRARRRPRRRSPDRAGIKILDGGAVTVAVSRLPTEYNPLTPAGSNAVTQMVMEQVLPAGLRHRARHGGPRRRWARRLGRGHRVSSPQTVVYTLAKGARWSDGVPITADRLRLRLAPRWSTMGRACRRRSRSPDTRTSLGHGSTTAKHGTTVTVVFSKPYADWMALFTNLVPAHVARRTAGEGVRPGRSPPTSSPAGPSSSPRSCPGKELVLSRNPALLGTARPPRPHCFRRGAPRGDAAGAAGGLVDLAELAPGTNVTPSSRGASSRADHLGLLDALAARLQLRRPGRGPARDARGDRRGDQHARRSSPTRSASTNRTPWRRATASTPPGSRGASRTTARSSPLTTPRRTSSSRRPATRLTPRASALRYGSTARPRPHGPEGQPDGRRR